MGMFKDLRNLTKQAKELKKTTPTPSMSDMVSQANAQLQQLSGQQAGAATLLQNGVPGTGIIRVMGTPARGASQFNLDLDLEVHVDGRDPYRVANMYMVPSTAQLGVGVELPIRVDRDDPAKIAIDWSQARLRRSRGRSGLRDGPAEPERLQSRWSGAHASRSRFSPASRKRMSASVFSP